MDIIQPDGVTSNMLDLRAVDALQALIDLGGRVAPSAAERVNGIRARFPEQEAALSILESLGTAMRFWPDDLDWSATQNPIMPGGAEGVTRGGANVMVISSLTQHPEEAWEFMKYHSATNGNTSG